MLRTLFRGAPEPESEEDMIMVPLVQEFAEEELSLRESVMQRLSEISERDSVMARLSEESQRVVKKQKTILLERVQKNGQIVRKYLEVGGKRVAEITNAKKHFQNIIRMKATVQSKIAEVKDVCAKDEDWEDAILSDDSEWEAEDGTHQEEDGEEMRILEREQLQLKRKLVHGALSIFFSIVMCYLSVILLCLFQAMTQQYDGTMYMQNGQNPVALYFDPAVVLEQYMENGKCYNHSSNHVFIGYPPAMGMNAFSSTAPMIPRYDVASTKFNIIGESRFEMENEVCANKEYNVSLSSYIGIAASSKYRSGAKITKTVRQITYSQDSSIAKMRDFLYTIMERAHSRNDSSTYPPTAGTTTRSSFPDRKTLRSIKKMEKSMYNSDMRKRDSHFETTAMATSSASIFPVALTRGMISQRRNAKKMDAKKVYGERVLNDLLNENYVKQVTTNMPTNVADVIARSRARRTALILVPQQSTMAVKRNNTAAVTTPAFRYGIPPKRARKDETRMMKADINVAVPKFKSQSARKQAYDKIKFWRDMEFTVPKNRFSLSDYHLPPMWKVATNSSSSAYFHSLIDSLWGDETYARTNFTSNYKVPTRYYNHNIRTSKAFKQYYLGSDKFIGSKFAGSKLSSTKKAPVYPIDNMRNSGVLPMTKTGNWNITNFQFQWKKRQSEAIIRSIQAESFKPVLSKKNVSSPVSMTEVPSTLARTNSSDFLPLVIVKKMQSEERLLQVVITGIKNGTELQTLIEHARKSGVLVSAEVHNSIANLSMRLSSDAFVSLYGKINKQPHWVTSSLLLPTPESKVVSRRAFQEAPRREISAPSNAGAIIVRPSTDLVATLFSVKERQVAPMAMFQRVDMFAKLQTVVRKLDALKSIQAVKPVQMGFCQRPIPTWDPSVMAPWMRDEIRASRKARRAAYGSKNRTRNIFKARGAYWGMIFQATHKSYFNTTAAGTSTGASNHWFQKSKAPIQPTKPAAKDMVFEPKNAKALSLDRLIELWEIASKLTTPVRDRSKQVVSADYFSAQKINTFRTKRSVQKSSGNFIGTTRLATIYHRMTNSTNGSCMPNFFEQYGNSTLVSN